MDAYHSLKAMGVFDYRFMDETFFACLGGLLLARLLVHPFVKSVQGVHFFVKGKALLPCVAPPSWLMMAV
jgi:hypothetical protein